MKELTMFYFEGCPHCQNAFRWHEEVFADKPELAQVPLKLIDEKEQPDLAAKYNYYYVPTYYLGEEKLFEGVVKKRLVEQAFQTAYDA